MHAQERDREPAEEGDGGGRVGGVESPKEDEGGDDGCGAEADVVHWVHPFAHR